MREMPSYKVYDEEITTFEQAIKFFEHATHLGDDACWSIKYYGFGEHFNYWLPDASFIDFNIDANTPINWAQMKRIIIESAEAHRKIVFKRRGKVDVDD